MRFKSDNRTIARCVLLLMHAPLPRTGLAIHLPWGLHGPGMGRAVGNILETEPTTPGCLLWPRLPGAFNGPTGVFGCLLGGGLYVKEREDAPQQKEGGDG